MSERLNTGSIAIGLVAAMNAGAARARSMQRRDVARRQLGTAMSRLEAAMLAEAELDEAQRRR